MPNPLRVYSGSSEVSILEEKIVHPQLSNSSVLRESVEEHGKNKAFSSYHNRLFSCFGHTKKQAEFSFIQVSQL